MSKPETTFYHGVHEHLPASLHHEKMHNPYSGGTWDVWYSGRRDLWVEYKFTAVPARTTTLVRPGLSPLQLAWGRKRYDEGRSLAVIVGVSNGKNAAGVILTGGEWETPLTCANFSSRIISRRDIAEWIIQATSA
jgi:hypothetical protein